MKVKVINVNKKIKRVVYGALIDELNVDFTQDLSQLKSDVEFALKTWIELNASNEGEFSKLLKKVKLNEVFVYEGGFHLNIVNNSGDLGWLTVEDHDLI